MSLKTRLTRIEQQQAAIRHAKWGACTCGDTINEYFSAVYHHNPWPPEREEEIADILFACPVHGKDTQCERDLLKVWGRPLEAEEQPA